MRKLVFTFFLSLIIFLSTSAIENYKLIKIFIPDQIAFKKLLSTGVDLEGASGKIGDWYHLTVSDFDMKMLLDEGFQVNVEIEDLTQFYSSRLSKQPYDAIGFGYGSMGGYFTLDEVVRQLDTMRLYYPNLITAKFSIGNSLQGRPIWAVKITKNADLPSTKPEIFYNALTHAREPAGMMSIVYFMWHLLQNYATDPEATYLIDNRQMYFVLVVNPDGYEANRRIAPNGGGMRRKNMRNVITDNDAEGVDLNRNFGYMWGYDNSGSSPTPSTQTYRGTSAFSEPETQVLRDLCNSRAAASNGFKLVLNYHTYSNLLIYPWGYIPSSETPDSLIYREYAKDMTQFNKYKYGTGDQTVGYLVNGDADDWMHGEQTTKNKILSFTPEVGSASDGFWPASSRILPLAQENLFPNLYTAYVAGSYLRSQQFTISDSSGDGILDRGEKFILNLSVRNKGLAASQSVSVRLTSSTPDLTVPKTYIAAGNIPAFSNQVIPINCGVSTRATTGVNANIYVRLTDESGLQVMDTLTLFIGKMNLVFADSANESLSNWTTGVSWGLSSVFSSPPNSFSDSPTGNYLNNTDNSLTLISNQNISGVSRAILKFRARWAIEAKYDFVTVEVSSNGGSSWTTVKGKYTVNASGIGVQTTGTFGYDGTQNTWVDEEIDVTQFASTLFKFRIRLRSDGSINADGFYVDDITLLTSKIDIAKYVDLAIEPTSIDFGNISLFDIKDSIITIRNLSTSTDTLRGIVQLLNTTDFILINGGVLSIPIGGSLNLNLSFNPKSIGEIEDTLRFIHNSDVIGNPMLIPLKGNGVSGVATSFLFGFTARSGSFSERIEFGSAAGATNGIDSAFGEIELPSMPTPGIFDLRWQISGTNGTRTDIRDTISQENKSNIYSCRYQLPTENDTIVLSWIRSELSFGKFHLRDSATNGDIISINMKKQDSLVIINPSVNSLVIVHEIIPVLTVDVNSGWNLVSLPIELEDSSKNNVFPGSISPAYIFSDGYVIKDTLKRGAGYWLKFNSARGYLFAGDELKTDTIDLKAGWNLIGSISQPVGISTLITEPANIIESEFYGYDSGYRTVQTILPGKGYWVKAKQNGRLILRINN
ncbi:MAG: M14 family zinc carboxypeptidase [Bacteroidota bacterium]|nr:M14 family zinc carboxypeptidase [Bacteroidota bacterium]